MTPGLPFLAFVPCLRPPLANSPVPSTIRGLAGEASRPQQREAAGWMKVGLGTAAWQRPLPPLPAVSSPCSQSDGESPAAEDPQPAQPGLGQPCGTPFGEGPAEPSWRRGKGGALWGARERQQKEKPGGEGERGNTDFFQSSK